MVLAMGLMVHACPAVAHHSFAAYDTTRTETAPGVIKEFHWSAPHCALVVTVDMPGGLTKDLLLVSGAPIMFAQQGFNPKSFRSGDKVQVEWHPNRNGSDGGSLASITLPDGRVFHDIPQQYGPPPGPLPGDQPASPPALQPAPPTR